MFGSPQEEADAPVASSDAPHAGDREVTIEELPHLMRSNYVSFVVSSVRELARGLVYRSGLVLLVGGGESSAKVSVC